MATTLEITRGDDKDFNLTFTDANGTAINITGYTLFFTVKPKVDNDNTDANAIISKTWTSHTNPVAGASTLSLTSANTSGLTPGKYLYDLQWKDGSSKIFTVLQVGPFIIHPDITGRTS